MANKNLLRKSQLEDFKVWLTAKEWKITPCVTSYEVARAYKDGQWIILFGSRGADFLTVRDHDYKTVKEFLRDRIKPALSA